MLIKVIAYCLVMFLWQIEGACCEKATVPYKICERRIVHQVNYTFNSTINDTIIFKGSGFLLSLLQPNFTTNSGCNDSLIRVKVNRTLFRQTESFLTVANYGILIGVNEEYRGLNSSILTKSTGEKIDNCYTKIVNVILENHERFALYFTLNISGNRLGPSSYYLHEPTQDLFCEDDIIMCPEGSENVAHMCECSKGTQLDVNRTKCTKCPKDHYQNMTGMFNCTACRPGYSTFSKTGSTQSEDCQPVPATTSKQPITSRQPTTLKRPTTTKPPKAHTPPTCNNGEYLNSTSNECFACPKNHYQDESNNTLCKECSEDTELPSCIKNGTKDVYVLAIVLPICVVVLLIFAVIIIFVLYPRKKRREYRKSFGENFLRKTIANNSMNRDVEADKYPCRPKSKITENEFYEDSPNNSDEEIEESSVSILGRLQEDVSRRNLEIPRDCITETRVRLGRGNFGEVRQIIVRKPDQPEMLCAAKMARGTRVPIEDMLDELEIHLKLNDVHENVVNLIGVCSSEGGPFYLIVEYCDNGSLLEYLRKYEPIGEYVNLEKRETLTMEWKLRCTLEICRGMGYLAKHRIVHRDLAARNVLLDKDTKAKISDFGMAKDVYLKSYYTQRHQGSFPLRWMACESIMKMEFTEKTDVWSFGVLVWEIFTDGTLPYYRLIDDEKVAFYILSGKTLKRPENCPKFLYSNIMSKCWSYKSFNRPKFWELCNMIEQHTNQLSHNEKGRALHSRLGRDVMKRFSDTKRSLKRRMSRKGSRQSVDEIMPHTSARKLSQASLDRLSSVSDSNKTRKLSQDMFFNPGADSDVDLSPFLRKKSIATPEDSNQNIEMLDVMGEEGQGYDDKDGLRNGQLSSINSETTLKARDNGLQRVDSDYNENSSEDFDNNEGPVEIPRLSENTVAEPGSFDIETNGNNCVSEDLEKPNSDCAKDTDFLSKTSERSSPVNTDDHLVNEGSKNTKKQHPEVPSKYLSHTNDDTEHCEQSVTTDLDNLSDNSCEDVTEHSDEFPADVKDALSNGMSSSETEQEVGSWPDQNMNENSDKTDKGEPDSFEAQDLKDSADKKESIETKQSSDESDFLSTVLNAMNGTVEEQGETNEDPAANSSSC